MVISKILVVDDEPDIVRTVSIRLKSNGYEVISAMNGAQAVSKAVKEAPDLIILDIGMPEADGHSVAKQLLEYPQTQFTPIIYLTARTAEIDFDKAVHSGASRYLTKPFDPEELLSVVTMLLSGHKRYR